MKKLIICILLLLVFSTLPAKSRFNESAIKAELRKPGVKLVAVDFYMTGCEPCDAAIPVWKELKKQYGDALKLIVVAPKRDDGSCTVKEWRPDKMICDEEMEIAEAWGVKDFPQAFLYSWHNNDPLVRLGHVKDVKKAIKEYFKEIPRVVLDADKSSRNLVVLVEEALIMNSKIELVSNESEQKQLLTLKKQSHQLNFDEDLKCELGKEISANSVLKITKEDGDLVLRLSSVEKSCTMAATTKPLSGDRKKLKTEVASAVYDLLSQMFGNISTPDEGAKPQQPAYSQPSGSSNRDAKACKYAQSENSIEAWQDYLDSFPDGECSFEAKGSIRKLKKEREEQERKAAYLKGRKIGSLIWSDRSSNKMNWQAAKEYCENLSEGGFDDWRLPTISELKTTIQNCQSGGSSCRVSDSCLSDDCWSKSCYCDGRGTNGGYYSKLGDDNSVILWSSSTCANYTDYALGVTFDGGGVVNYAKPGIRNVRCVR